MHDCAMCRIAYDPVRLWEGADESYIGALELVVKQVVQTQREQARRAERGN